MRLLYANNAPEYKSITIRIAKSDKRMAKVRQNIYEHYIKVGCPQQRTRPRERTRLMRNSAASTRLLHSQSLSHSTITARLRPDRSQCRPGAGAGSESETQVLEPK
jgi:hypothetical protein